MAVTRVKGSTLLVFKQTDSFLLHPKEISVFFETKKQWLRSVILLIP